MGGPRRFQLGSKLVANDAMHRRVAELNTASLCKPLLDLFVAAKALWLREALLEALHHLRWDRLLSRIGAGIFDLLDLLDASFFVEGKPIGNGMAMDLQVASGSASAFGLSGLQKTEHLEAALDLSVFLLANEALKLFDRLGNIRKVVHVRQHFLSGAIRSQQPPILYSDPQYLV